jgi:hypothetical protein
MGEQDGRVEPWDIARERGSLRRLGVALAVRLPIRPAWPQASTISMLAPGLGLIHSQASE